MTAPTLAAFIEAQVEADEAPTWRLVPYSCEPGCCAPAGYVGHECLICNETSFGGTVKAITEIAEEHDEQIHGRAQVLRTCAAVRAVLAIHESVPTQRPGTEDFQHDYMDVCRSCDFQPYPCPTLTALAAMYAGRDGYGDATA